jgi:hypothetical protein
MASGFGGTFWTVLMLLKKSLDGAKELKIGVSKKPARKAKEKSKKGKNMKVKIKGKKAKPAKIKVKKGKKRR